MTLKYDQHGRPYEDLTEEHKELTRRVKELENSLSIALEINDKFQKESIKLTKRAQEAEGELTIIKGIGNTSPEIKDSQIVLINSDFDIKYKINRELLHRMIISMNC